MTRPISVEYKDEYGQEHQLRDAGLCEYCGSPVNREGEAIPEDINPDLVKQIAVRIAGRMWDTPDIAEAVYARVILGKTNKEIAVRFGKSRQAINYLLVKGAKKWPELGRMMFERKNGTSNKTAMQGSNKT